MKDHHPASSSHVLIDYAELEKNYKPGVEIADGFDVHDMC